MMLRIEETMNLFFLVRRSPRVSFFVSSFTTGTCVNFLFRSGWRRVDKANCKRSSRPLLNAVRRRTNERFRTFIAWLYKCMTGTWTLDSRRRRSLLNERRVVSVTNNAPRTKYNYIRTYVKRRPSSITKRVVCVIVRSFVRRCVRACTPEYSSKNKIMIIGRCFYCCKS